MLFPLLSAFSSLLLACFHLVAHLVGQSIARSTNGSHDRGDPLISQVGGNKTTWFVEQARGHFEYIRSALPAHHVIHSGVVIMSQGKKLNTHSDQAILVL